MTTARSILAAAAAAFALSAAQAIAGPLPPVAPAEAPSAIEEGLVTQVQGRMCLVGQPPYQRYVPCHHLRRDRGHYAPQPRYYAQPQPRYYAPPPPHCGPVYNMCYAQFGRGSPAYTACMRARGC